MLTTLLQPTSGTVELDGLNPVVERDQVRKRFGICSGHMLQDILRVEGLEVSIA
jgi:ABC-type multidrug transport system ATPase subunit